MSRFASLYPPDIFIPVEKDPAITLLYLDNPVGLSAGVTYSNPGYTANVNSTYSKLRKSSGENGLKDGCNTPEWMVNISASKNEIFKHTGAGITWRWQSSYYWQSFLVNGTTPAYSTLDAQATYSFNTGYKLKAGATNLLNKYYYSFLGGPSIGGMYYLTSSTRIIFIGSKAQPQ